MKQSIGEMQVYKLIVKNMSCHCCLKLVRRILEEHRITVLDVHLGEVKVSLIDDEPDLQQIARILEAEGFELVFDREKQLCEQIKNAVIDLVHHSTFNSMVRNSDYLIEKFNLSYQYISAIFSRQENITLEKFIILQKIEKVKELIQYGELNLSEIAFMMGYSSVQYLSTQFKNVTGISVSEFKKDPAGYRKSIDGLTE
ncbi:MAG: helix-turn-helix domain-containing protein [Bacteroidales bacterium]